MKFLSYNSLLVLVLFMLFLNGGCTKNVAGPKGEQGTPGQNGNMVHSYVTSYSQSSSAWTFDGRSWNSSITMAGITDNVIAQGEVVVYIQVGKEWWTLPHAVGDTFTQLSFKKGQVLLERTKIHDGPPAKPETTNFKIVIFAPVQ